jgi:hypothetical protein
MIQKVCILRCISVFWRSDTQCELSNYHIVNIMILKVAIILQEEVLFAVQEIVVAASAEYLRQVLLRTHNSYVISMEADAVRKITGNIINCSKSVEADAVRKITGNIIN